MKRLTILLLPCLAIFSLLLLGGCADTSKSLDQSRLPWGKPSDWEMQMPGIPLS